jgi:endonuclease/exonuclease/phosphatase family metal-dependent hydrolase|tara:strand:+ start:11969 stop:13015 length:1047 start_codon:yes stop_codon:yes gene_type:complete
MYMINSLNKYLLIIIFILACSSGGNSPTDPADNNGDSNNTNSYEFPNAVDYGLSNQVEIVTWNIRQFPQDSSSDDYVKALLEKWNADIYLLQEVSGSNIKRDQLISMINSMTDYSYVLDEESGNLGYALLYKSDYISYISTNELWHDTPNSINDCGGNYLNCKQYQFASRPPMESYLSWTDGTKTINFYTINVHYKASGDGIYDSSDLTKPATRRHHASLLLSDYIINNRTSDNVFLVGDFNNVGAQDITNPALSPFTDDDNFNSASSFKLTDLSVLLGPKSGWSWQGWESSYDESHFDHIIINQPLFSYDATSSIEVINLPSQVGISTYNLREEVSDHQPVIYRFYP